MNNGYKHAIQYQLFLYAYPHGKRVMPLVCERVIMCRVRAFTLFPEIPWRVTNEKMFKFKMTDSPLCSFCKREVESLKHLLSYSDMTDFLGKPSLLGLVNFYQLASFYYNRNSLWSSRCGR